MKKMGSFNPLNLREQRHFLKQKMYLFTTQQRPDAFSTNKHHVKVSVSDVRSSRTDTELNKYAVLQPHRLDTTTKACKTYAS